MVLRKVTGYVGGIVTGASQGMALVTASWSPSARGLLALVTASWGCNTSQESLRAAICIWDILFEGTYCLKMG